MQPFNYNLILKFMRVFKFGGASVKDANAIKNVVEIIEDYSSKSKKLIIVVSAIGKTTNKLEQLVKQIFENKNASIEITNEIIKEHIDIAIQLGFEANSDVIRHIETTQERILGFISSNESNNYNYVYDQIVSKGEVLSSLILNEYIRFKGNNCIFVNARHLIKTDSNYTDANIMWKETEEAIQDTIAKISEKIIVTQGFIGANSEMLYTTLGREGSDYTAAIISYALKIEELTIWKDVDGVYTADPKKFPEATIINQLSYKEAIEMTFYGAQIIHPKTIKPIQNSNCILKVKSFINKEAKGTEIGNFDISNYNPVIVLKEQQVLYTFSVRDFSFLNENNLGKIIDTFGKYSLRINLMQNTAIQFIVATDEKIGKNEQIIEDLGNHFEIQVENNLQLLTIRHYHPEIIKSYTENKNIFISQRNPDTVQYLIRTS